MIPGIYNLVSNINSREGINEKMVDKGAIFKCLAIKYLPSIKALVSGPLLKQIHPLLFLKLPYNVFWFVFE
jgi:hypothetical protein